MPKSTFPWYTVSKYRGNTRHYNLSVLDMPKTDRYVKVQFHIELIRYRADSIVKSKIHEIGILSDQTLSNSVA